MTALPLSGFTVAITGDRRSDEQAELLRRRGATIVHGPMIETRSLTDDLALRSATEAIIADPPQIVVATTGVGIRSWMEAADGLGLGAALRDVMSGAHVVARSPKAAGALVTAGLRCDWKADEETNAGLIEHLSGRDLRGVRMAVQRDGSNVANLAQTLEAMAADVIDVPVYRWSVPTDLTPAHRLLGALADRQIDAVTVTSAPALQNLLEIADSRADRAQIRRVLRREVTVACVGPVCSERARREGITRIIQPQRFRLGSMVKALTDSLTATSWSLSLPGGELRVQGTLAAVGGIEVSLTRREHLVLSRLVAAGGAVVPKTELARAVWGPDVDLHVLEVTIGRLRRRLGRAGSVVVTVPRRGYRLAARPSCPA